MKLVTLARRLRAPARRRRSTSLDVESIEERLAPSPISLLPHVPSIAAAAFPHESPSANAETVVAALDEPPDPCQLEPPDPC